MRQRDRKKEHLNTDFLDAVKNNDIRTCQRILDDGADVNAACQDSGATALMVSTAWGYLDLVSLLLERDASPLVTDKEGRTPVHVAAAQGNEELLFILLNYKHADQLLNKQVDINHRNEDYLNCIDSWIHEHDDLLPEIPQISAGCTPLHVASQWSFAGCVELLLERGADTELRDSRGLTPLDVAGEVEYRADNFNEVVHDNESRELADFSRKCLTKGVIECLRRNVLDKKHVDEEHDEDIESEEDEKSSTSLSEDGEELEGDSLGRMEQKGMEIATSSTANRPDFQQYLISNSRNIHIGPTYPQKIHITPKIIKEDVSYSVKVEKNCLHTAVKEEDDDLVEYLMNENSNYLFQLDENWLTPGHLAVKMKNLRILSLITKHKKAINATDGRGQSLLYTCAQIGWHKGVDFLLNANADIKKQANDGSTVLHVASRKQESKLLEELLTFRNAKRIINEVDNKSQTPLWCAVEESSIACVECLLSSGANVSTIKRLEGLTLLHVAARNGSRIIMEQLLNHGAISMIDILTDRFHHYGLTALHLCCEEGHVDCVRLLINHGAIISCRTICDKSPYYGASPLHLAVKYGHEDVAKILIEKDKDILNRRNAKNWQPLHIAARFGKTDCVRLLIESGGDLASKVKFADGYRKTALDMIERFIPQSFEFLQNILDSYITTNDSALLHADGTVTFNYDLFFPRGNSNPIAVLDAIRMTPDHRLQKMLLLHPLTETFLFLTWKKLRFLFFLIFSIHIIFTTSITIMNLSVCSKVLPESISSNFYVLLVATLISIIFLAIPEIFLACRLRLNYLTEIEALGKLITYGLAGWLCIVELKFEQKSPKCYENISSVTVFLAWMELLMMLSQLPDWGSSVLMFFRVVRNVLKVLSKFSIMFLGFTFALMIQFKSELPFSSIWESLLKIISMLHDIEYDDMLKTSQLKSEESNLPWSLTLRILLASFIILISISLMNLLIGLAVNDIAQLEAQARTNRFMKQITFLSFVFTYYNLLLTKSPKFFKRIFESRIEVPSFLRLGKDKDNLKIFPILIRNSVFNKLFSVKKLAETSNLKDPNEKRYELIDNQLLTWENSYKVCGTIQP